MTARCPGCGEADGIRYGPDMVCWECWDRQHGGDGTIPEPRNSDPGENTTPVAVVPIGDFAQVDEPGAQALLGTDEAALIAENGDCMFYGDGGAGKTTLSIDAAFHLATGTDWLGIPVARPARLLIIENEGPRALLRKKLRRKLEAWANAGRAAIGNQIQVFERPWGRFTLDTELWREEIALKIAANGIDVIIAGPLTRIGMEGAGTLQEVAAFMQLIQDVRERSRRPLTVIVIHHESKSGSVSGACEGSGDTLLHVQAAGNGHTILHVQKARWDSERHGTTLKLAWADGEGFTLEGDRDLVAEIEELFSDRQWRTVKQIATSKDANRPGIGANADAIREILEKHPYKFESRTGDRAKEVGRRPDATVWNVTQTPESPGAIGDSLGTERSGLHQTPPLRESGAPGGPPSTAPNVTQPPESPDSNGRPDDLHAITPQSGDWRDLVDPDDPLEERG